jgi:hypothetical protein
LLQLADEAMNVKMIRNPFFINQKAMISSKWNVSDSWVISRNGRILTCGSGKNQVVCHKLPGRSGRQVDAQRTQFEIPEEQTCFGVYASVRRTLLICFDKNNFYLHNYPESRVVKKIKAWQVMPAKGSSLINMVFTGYRYNNNRVLLLDSKGVLRSVNLGDKPLFFEIEDRDVIALGENTDCEYYARYDREYQKINIFWYLANELPCKRSYEIEYSGKLPRIYFHGSRRWKINYIGCAAIENDDQTWCLISGDTATKIQPNPAYDMIGTMWLNIRRFDLKSVTKPMQVMIGLSENKQSIYACWNNNEVRLLDFQTPIINAELNHTLPYLHYVNELNDLVVVDLISGNELIRLAQEAKQKCC